MNLLLLALALLPWAATPAALFTRLFIAISLFSVEMQLITVTGAGTLRSLAIVNVVLAALLAGWQWRRAGAPFAAWNRSLLPLAPWPIIGLLAAVVLLLNVTRPLEAADPYHLDRVAQIERFGTLAYDPAAEPKVNVVGWLYELVLADLDQVPAVGPALVRLHGVFGLALFLIALAAVQTWLQPWPSKWTLAALFVVPPLFHELVLIKNDLFLALPAFVALVWLITSAESASWRDGVWGGWLIGLAVASKVTSFPLALAVVAGVLLAQQMWDWRPVAGVVLGGLLGALTGGLFFSMYANTVVYGDPLASAQVQDVGNVTQSAGEALVSVTRFVISLFDLGLVTRVLWPGRGGWGGTFGLPFLWALAVLALHARLRPARWVLAIAGFQFIVFAAVFPDADLSHRIVLAPALAAIVVALHLVNTQDRYRGAAVAGLVAVLVLTGAQLARSAMQYFTAA